MKKKKAIEIKCLVCLDDMYGYENDRKFTHIIRPELVIAKKCIHNGETGFVHLSCIVKTPKIEVIGLTEDLRELYNQ